MDIHASTSGQHAIDNIDNYSLIPSTPTSDFDREPFIHSENEPEPEPAPEHEEESEEGEIPLPTPHPAIVFVFNTIKAILTPVMRVLFAPEAQRTIIKSIAISTVLAWVLLTSVAAYLAFYRQYVPQTAHIEQIYFQYDRHTEGPTDIVDLAQGQLFPPLRHEQAYDVSVRLHVPTSDINFDLGNFMIKVWLQTADGSPIANSSRPAILRYQSLTQRIMRVFAKALPLLVGLTEESQVITVPLIEGHMENKAQPVTHATVSLSSNRVQIYDAELHVVADFHGLRYYMYHRRLITAIGFIVMFIGIEVICAAIAWKFFGQNMWNKLHDALDQMGNTTEEAIEVSEDAQPAVYEDEEASLSESKNSD